MDKKARFKIDDIVFKKVEIRSGVLARPLVVKGVERYETRDTYKVQIGDNYRVFEERLASLSEAISLFDEKSKNDITFYLDRLKNEFKLRKKILELKKAFDANARFDEILKII